MKIIKMGKAPALGRKTVNAPGTEGRPGRMYNLSSYAYERDKRNVAVELREYFVSKNREEDAWHTINSLMAGLRRGRLTSGEARKILLFLAGKFNIRSADLEYISNFSRPASAGKSGVHNLSHKRSQGDAEVFRDLFLSLQLAVQKEIIDYKDARALVMEIVTSHPETAEYLEG